MPDPTADLQFEHATYDQAKPALACGTCGKPVEGEYWQWIGRVTCARCRDGVHALEARARSPQTFARAAIVGAATALGCGVAYGLFVAVSHMQIALITIGIAYVVASVIRKATGNVSGRRYQVLAVALTYAASTMGYAPELWREVAHGPDGQAHAEVAPDAGDVPSASGPQDRGSPTGRPAVPPLAFAKFVASVTLLLLAAPFLAARGAPIGLLIVGFGLWEAWRRAKGLPMEVTGPYRVTATAPPPTP